MGKDSRPRLDTIRGDRQSVCRRQAGGCWQTSRVCLNGRRCWRHGGVRALPAGRIGRCSTMAAGHRKPVANGDDIATLNYPIVYTEISCDEPLVILLALAIATHKEAAIRWQWLHLKIRNCRAKGGIRRHIGAKPHRSGAGGVNFRSTGRNGADKRKTPLCDTLIGCSTFCSTFYRRLATPIPSSSTPVNPHDYWFGGLFKKRIGAEKHARSETFKSVASAISPRRR